MPFYKVKPEKYPTDIPVAASSPKERYPTVYVPVSKEIVDALEVGGTVTVTLKGKVDGLRSNKNGKHESNELTVELREVEAYPGSRGMKDAIDKGLGYKGKDD